MSSLTTDRCFDNQPHDFQHLRQELEETGVYHPRFRTFDVFFCRKCLVYQRVEVTKNA